MKSCLFVAMVLLALITSGCVTSPQVRTLQSENNRLSADLADAKGNVARLEGEAGELLQANTALQYEKDARSEETSGIRHGARAFVKGHVQTLRDFAQNRNLLDFVGGETIERPAVEGENILLVDMKHAFASSGVLIGANALARKATRASFCVLRLQKDKLVVMWMSAPFDIPAGEPAQFTFDAPVAVQAGDLIGAYAPEALGIPYDRGTGDTRTLRGPVKVGQIIRPSTMDGSQKRSYSFGAVGFLD